jgi:hypothetical protein
MSFSSLEAGHGTSSGAALYPLRTLVRDLLEREVQRELEARLDHAEEQFPLSDRTDEDHADWLRSDDSPLLLHTVEEFVLDPDAHLRAIAERVEGPSCAPQFSGAELARGATRDNLRARAEELRARLRTMAELDAERVLAAPRLRGTPKGETRTHYVWLVSLDRNISNGDLKRLILEIIKRRWPGAVVVGYIHRDTDNTHLHIWLSAETLSGKKINVARATPSGDAILDKYPDVDEEVARAVSRHFGDPSIYDGHIARKLEWVHWRERFDEALRRGERLPVMPHRARHDYDWVGERRAVSDRERGEGLSVMSEADRLNDHVRGLAERFSQVACDAGHDPERLGLDRRELEARAERVLSEAVERFGREERDSQELGRLEARMILACALRDKAASRQQRFADHAHFHRWTYETLDGRGSASLCEIWFAYHEETDPAAQLVAQDAEQHIVRSINEVHARLAETEAARADEAEAATRAYEARAQELSPRGVTTRGPVFEPGELGQLEEAAVITRDHELIGIVSRREEEAYGQEYATARVMGRVMWAAAVVHAEHGVPENFEHPVAAVRIERLPGHVRDSLSELLARHREARETERGAALSFREGLETQAGERAGEVSRATHGAIKPLLTEAEAGEIFGRMLAMDTNERRSWERLTMHAEVAVGAADSTRGNPIQSLHEWARQNTFAVNHGSEYERGVGDTMVLSHREARAIIRQQEKELGRDHPTPSRGR